MAAAYSIVESTPRRRVTGLPSGPNCQLVCSLSHDLNQRGLPVLFVDLMSQHWLNPHARQQTPLGQRTLTKCAKAISSVGNLRVRK
jgi:hypothetical protein